jgi:Polyketide cyclase / dehydrase and lipid transport
MPPIVAAAEVDRPAADVFAYTTDPTRFPEWQAGVVSGRLDGGDAVGARCITVRRIGGAERPSTSELVRRDPPRAWAVRGLDGPIRAYVDVTVEPLDANRSRVAIAVDFTGHGIGKLLVPLVVRREARKEMPANLARLKGRLEDGASQRSGGAP